MSTVGYATLQIIPSARGFGAALGNETGAPSTAAGKQAGAAFGGGMLATMKGFAGPIAAIGIADALHDSVNVASDLNEQGNVLAVTFGTAAGKIAAFADTGPKALGLSKLAAQEAAAQFGMFGKTAGLTGDALADFSTGLVRLSTDIASFRNAKPEEVALALGAALRGEAEPIRRFGVLLDDATLRAEALKLGLIATTKDALTPQQKVLAAHAVIMKQTTDAQGDFARTSDGLANKQRILAGQWEDMKGKLGAALLPAMTETVGRMSSMLDFVQANISWLGPLAATLLGVAVAVKAVSMATAAWQAIQTTISAVTKVWTGVQWLLNVALTANPIGLVIIAVAALIAVIVLIATKTDWFQRIWAVAWSGIKTAAKAVGDWFSGPFVNAFKTAAAWLVALPGRIWEGIKALPDLIVNTIKVGLEKAVYWVGFYIGLQIKFWTEMPGKVWGIITSLWTKAVELYVNGVNAVTAWVVKFVTDSIAWVQSLPGRVWAIVTQLWSETVRLTTEGVTKVVAFFKALPGQVFEAARTLPGKLWDALVDAVDKAKDIGKNIVQGLIDGVRSLAGALVAEAKRLATSFTSGIKDALGIHSPSRVMRAIGVNVSEGMALGINDGAADVLKASNALAGIPGQGDGLGVTVGARGATSGSATYHIDRLVEFSGDVSVRSDQDLLELSRGIARETTRRLRALGTQVEFGGATT